MRENPEPEPTAVVETTSLLPEPSELAKLMLTAHPGEHPEAALHNVVRALLYARDFYNEHKHDTALDLARAARDFEAMDREWVKLFTQANPNLRLDPQLKDDEVRAFLRKEKLIGLKKARSILDNLKRHARASAADKFVKDKEGLRAPAQVCAGMTQRERDAAICNRARAAGWDEAAWEQQYSAELEARRDGRAFMIPLWDLSKLAAWKKSLKRSGGKKSFNKSFDIALPPESPGCVPP